MNQRPYPVSNYREYKSTRNPYVAKIKEFRALQEKPTILADQETEQQKGKWRDFFNAPEDAFLSLELGTYHGETSLHLAKNHPENLHLGMEWKHKQCFKGGKKAQDFGHNYILEKI